MAGTGMIPVGIGGVLERTGDDIQLKELSNK
jgi:hypothetical protein